MADELNKIASDIEFNLITGKEIKDQISSVFALGYKYGKADQKRITQRLKFKYNILLDWYTSQLQQFSYFTKRAEYKQILEGIEDQVDQYRFENALNGSYKTKDYVACFEHGKEPETANYKTELSYLLVDVMGNFIKQEDDKQLREKERMLTKKQTNE